MNKQNKNVRVKITDVARHAGVSPTTVSFVLHGKGRISGKTKEAVRKAIEELGYVYDRSAANLRMRNSQLVALLIQDISNQFFAEIASGAESILAKNGYLAVISNTADDLERQRVLLQSMAEHGVAGFIIDPAIGTQEKDLRIVDSFGGACVLCVRNVPSVHFDFVGADDYEGALLALEHLVKLGHRDIAFVGGLRGAIPHTNRLAAYCAILERNGIPFQEDLVITSTPTRESGRLAALDLIERKKHFTAAICYDDGVAFGFCIGLRQEGLVVAEDVAVVGFGNFPESEAWMPSLTTVETSPRLIGQEAARLLLDQMEKGHATPSETLFKPKLLVRGSSGGRIDFNDHQ